MSKKTHSIIAFALAIIFIILAVYYWITPAGALPGFIPGHETGSMTVHIKHGMASFILGLGLFAYAWFSGGKKASK
jgi:hypothetical protein